MNLKTFSSLCLIVFTCLIMAGLAEAQSPPPPKKTSEVPRHYYEYVLYFRTDPSRDLVSEATSLVQPLLKRHQVADVSTINNSDTLSIAFEKRLRSRSTYMKMAKTDESIAELLDQKDLGEVLRKLDLIKSVSPVPAIVELAIMINLPKERDIESYIEALNMTYEVAKHFHARNFRDVELGLLLPFEYLQNERDHYEPKGMPSSIGGFPIFVESVKHVGQAAHTRGMVKFGIPELVLEPASSIRPLEIVADVLLLGARADASSGVLAIDGHDPVIRQKARVPLGGSSSVRIVPMALSPNGRPQLRLLFEAQKQTSVFEKQMEFLLDLGSVFHPKLNREVERDWRFAVARTRGKIANLRQNFQALTKKGVRVFISFRTDLDLLWLAVPCENVTWLKDPCMISEGDRSKMISEGHERWYQIVKWEAEDINGDISVRKFTRDPRSGGVSAQTSRELVKLLKSLNPNEPVPKCEDKELEEQDIEDILLVQKDGRAEGGEVRAFLQSQLPK
jgi:hypothetical protein